MRITRHLALLSVACLVVASLADGAEGQRRRRPPRRPEPAPAAVAPPEAADVTGEEDPMGGPPAPEVVPEAPPEPPADPLAELPDVGPVRAELEALMDELVQTRSRIAVLGRQLFQTRVRITVQNRGGNAQILGRLDLRLDGAPVFDAERDLEGLAAGRRVFEGFAAPGPHVLTVSLEQRARADEEFRYSQHDTYRFRVERGQLTDVTITLYDRSGIARDYARGGEGEFDVRTRVRVATRELREE